ncbi:VOC family protein [Vibrio vulnificus]|uniref:VOC family protein n=1 Tax=Vibrio vulnificus TaxID=672 RepID=UPI001A1C76A3|nr:VOC family protein [Vibrio vulnificus]MDS1845058.1 VOC family protein [Vibrio vulnificus]HAS8285029.1 VOC family protein [Vibrio vulnificus]
MDKNPIGWFEIYVDDVERAKHFYQSIFQVTFEQMMDPTGTDIEMWFFPSDMESYGASGALVKMDGISAGAGGTLVYFACEQERATQHGGVVVQAKMAIGEYGFISLVQDSEGNMIGLHSMQ